MVVWSAFHPHDYSTIITFGRQHISFWRLFWEEDHAGAGATGGRLLRDKHSGAFDVDQIPNLVTVVAFGLSGDVITGDASGRIFVWIKYNSDAFVVDKRASENMRHAHEKPVLSLCMLEDGTLLSGGGTEIKAWDTMNYFKRVKERTIPEGCGHVRTIVASSRGGADGLLYVGTTKNSILHGSLQDKMATVVHVSIMELPIAFAPDYPLFLSDVLC